LSRTLTTYDGYKLLGLVEEILINKLGLGEQSLTRQPDDNFHTYPEFEEIPVPKAVFERMDEVKTQRQLRADYNVVKHSSQSLNKLISTNGGILKSIRNAKRVLNKYDPTIFESLDNEDAELASEYEYFYSLLTSFRLIRNFQRRKHVKRIGTVQYAPEFCALCWRRTRWMSSELSAHYSKFYCGKHHPSMDQMTKAANRSDSDWLIKLIECEAEKKPIYKYDLNRIKRRLKPGDKARILYKWLNDQSPKIHLQHKIKNGSFEHPGALFADRINNDWREAAKELVSLIEDTYPDAFEKIKGTVDNSNSWEEWIIFGVVRSLSEKHETSEIDYWKQIADARKSDDRRKKADERKKSKEEKEKEKKKEREEWWKKYDLTLPEEWPAIVLLLRRYQATSELKRFMKPVGRKESAIIRARRFIKEHFDTYSEIPSHSQIESSCSVSRGTAHNALKEFKEEHNPH